MSLINCLDHVSPLTGIPRKERTRTNAEALPVGTTPVSLSDSRCLLRPMMFFLKFVPNLVFWWHMFF